MLTVTVHETLCTLVKNISELPLLCQGISTGGYQEGLQDCRTGLLVHTFRIFDSLPAKQRRNTTREPCCCFSLVPIFSSMWLLLAIMLGKKARHARLWQVADLLGKRQGDFVEDHQHGGSHALLDRGLSDRHPGLCMYHLPLSLARRRPKEDWLWCGQAQRSRMLACLPCPQLLLSFLFLFASSSTQSDEAQRRRVFFWAIRKGDKLFKEIQTGCYVWSKNFSAEILPCALSPSKFVLQSNMPREANFNFNFDNVFDCTDCLWKRIFD